MKKINNNNKLEFLKEEFEETLQELQDKMIHYSTSIENEIDFSTIMLRIIEGSLSVEELELFSDLKKCYLRFIELEARIMKLEFIERCKEQVEQSYSSYAIQQDIEKAENAYYETYIPEEVNTGILCDSEGLIKSNVKPIYNDATARQVVTGSVLDMGQQESTDSLIQIPGKSRSRVGRNKNTKYYFQA